jgi:hypothetical protein
LDNPIDSPALYTPHEDTSIIERQQRVSVNISPQGMKTAQAGDRDGS